MPADKNEIRKRVAAFLVGHARDVAREHGLNRNLVVEPSATDLLIDFGPALIAITGGNMDGFADVMSSLIEEAPDEPITKARMQAALDRYLTEHSSLRN